MRITKKNIIRQSLKDLFGVLMGIATISVIFAIVMVFVTNNQKNLNFENIIILSTTPLICLVPVFLTYITICLPRMLMVNRMERILGIDIEKELINKRIRFNRYIDDDWFIFITGAKFILIRRDYINNVISMCEERHKNYDIVFESCDEKIIKWNILAYLDSEKYFAEWIERGNKHGR